jgi:hypothetical protein
MPNSPNSDQWVIFDGDNTLWDIEHLYNDARNEMCEYISSLCEADESDIEELQQQRDKQLYKTHGYRPIDFQGRSKIQP